LLLARRPVSRSWRCGICYLCFQTHAARARPPEKLDQWMDRDTDDRGVFRQLTAVPHPSDTATTKPRLIYVWNYLNWGGAQIYLLAIMKEAKADWDVVVILPHGSSSDILNFLDQIGVSYEFIDACIDSDAAPTVKRKLQRQYSRIRAELRTFLYLRRYDLKRSI